MEIICSDCNNEMLHDLTDDRDGLLNVGTLLQCQNCMYINTNFGINSKYYRYTYFLNTIETIFAYDLILNINDVEYCILGKNGKDKKIEICNYLNPNLFEINIDFIQIDIKDIVRSSKEIFGKYIEKYNKLKCYI